MIRVHKTQCSTCIFRPPARPTTPCIEWTSATINGYGVRRINGRVVRVHRLAWEEKNGPIPSDKIVMHTCDNPPCYRHDHLVLGTHKMNSDDKWAKGRGNAPRGEQAGRALLTEAQVFNVLQRLQAGESQRSIAKHYGVSAGAIQGIADGRNWKHLIALPLGNLMNMAPGRVEQMVREAVRNESCIPCHQTLPAYTGDSTGVQKGETYNVIEPEGRQAVCAGFYQRHRWDTLLGLAEKMGFIEMVESRKEHAS